MKAIDSEKTQVVFRKFKDGDLVALFPGINEVDGRCLCYQKIGQHGTAEYNYVMRKTKRATASEYFYLAKELESIGYNLKVIRRFFGGGK